MIQEIRGDFLQWLRGFYLVAKDKSFSRAGLEMGRNQPTVSHQVKCLEKEFGLTLIDRSGSKLELTLEGRFFFQKTISIFEKIKEMRDYANHAVSKIEGEISIASTQAVINYFLPHHISEFIKRYPKVTFNAEGGGLENILAKIESADADFAILNQDSVPKDFIYYDLFETKLVLITSRKGPYTIKGNFNLSDIAKVPFISPPKTSSTAYSIGKRFSDAGLKLNTVAIFNNFEAVKRYVSLGLGVTILDDYMLAQEDKERFDIFPLEVFFQPRRYGIVLQRKKYLSLAVKKFLKTIKPDIPIN